MKKIVLTTAIAASALLTANLAPASPATSELKVKIEGIRETKGTILVALGDYTKPAEMVYTMIQASDGSVECTLSGEIDLSDMLHVFHDVNGNFMLDVTGTGIPTEGCYSDQVALDEDGAAVVELMYYAETTEAETK